MLEPLTIILILLTLGLLLVWQKKHIKSGRWLTLLGTIAFIFAGYGLVGRSLLEGLERRYPPLTDVSRATVPAPAEGQGLWS
ncbi:MAG: hypothetical protein Q7W05_11425, partial [Deltaproteobacteria bacterium]|nr:hypothetical protein [Deltaproteobacteria bacterium]